MSTAPSPYQRQANFTSFEQSSPTLPKRGSDLDAEFNAVRTLANALLSRLSEIQRDDGQIRNGAVRPDALSADVLTLIGSDITPRGDWATDTVYDARDLVNFSGTTYVAVSEHMSGVFAVDLGAGKWQGLTASTAAGDIPFTPAGGLLSTDVQAAIAELAGIAAAKQAGNANLTALAGLTGLADRLFYFTGPGALALATFGVFGRSMASASDQNYAQTILGLIPGVTAGDIVQLDGVTGYLPAVDGRNLTNVTPGNATVGEAQLAATLNLSAKTITLPAANTPVFTKSYTSSNQTITAAGALTLAHSLGAMPKLIQARLVCQTAEFGYSIGDEVIINPAESSITNNQGLSLVPDATNINVRFGANASSLIVIRKDTGALANITNANWRLVLRAWA